MLFSSLAILATLVPAMAMDSHNAPHLRHRRQAEIAKRAEEARGLLPNKAGIARSNEAHADAHRAVKRVMKKRGAQCRARVTSSSATAAAVATSDVPAASSIAIASTTDAASAGYENNWAHASSASSAVPTTTSAAWSAPASSSEAPASTTTQSSGGGSSNPASGVLDFTDATCGPSNATPDSPNGAEGWLNCGLDGSGWTPPAVQINQLIASELNADGIFSPCAPYIDKFNQYGNEFGVPAIMLASFAMQESTCNPSVVGGNGEAGLMQIAPPNCEAGNDCWNVDYNIRRGAQLFSQMIDANGGNVLAAIGSYNGWQTGMTVGDGTAAASQGNCFAQNNLDYLHQFCNGWMQNKNAYTMGSYFNLAAC